MTTFQTGKSFKVKVELAPGQIGFGRATVVEREGNKIFVQLKTSKESNQVLPKGARLWIVPDSPIVPFAGLWATTVTGARIVGGHTVMECSLPKFEPQVQRRRAQRLPLDCPVRLAGESKSRRVYELRSRNVSSSGLGLEASSRDAEADFVPGDAAEVVIETHSGEIPVKCRVIRTDYNWLHNRTSIGLEFIDMSEQARHNLDELLHILGASAPKEEAEAKEAGQRQGLFGWVKTTRPDTSFIKSRARPVEDSGNGEVASGEEDKGK